VIFQDSLQHSKDLKVAGTYVWRIGCDNRETWYFSNFDATFDPLWHIELSTCTQKPPAGSDDENSRFPFSNREKCNRQNLAGCIYFLSVRWGARLIGVRWRKSLS
jgi:hypothetical protein